MEDNIIKAFKELIDIQFKHSNEKLDYLKDKISTIDDIRVELKIIKSKIDLIDRHVDNHDDIVIEVIRDYLSRDNGLAELAEKIINSDYMIDKIKSLIDEISNKKTAAKVGFFKREAATGFRIIIVAIITAIILAIIGLKK